MSIEMLKLIARKHRFKVVQLLKLFNMILRVQSMLREKNKNNL